jgi:hypothetical protein
MKRRLEGPIGLIIFLVAMSLITTDVSAAQRAKLVIVSAVYGDLANGKTTDVTKQVAERVKDENLSLEVTKEIFGDPAPAATNKLKVGYTIDGLYHTKTVDQGDVLDISTRLFIRKAVYGDLPKGKSDDVTQQIADLVRKNSLSVKADNETFGDPAQNVVKRLRVDYLFDGVKGSKTVAEGQTLTVSDKGR